MSRRMMLGFALVLLGAPAQAQEPPEKLLSPSTQLFIRWDGVGPHADAYRNSALGDVMAGPTGDTVRTLLARGPKLLGADLLAEPLLDGKPPAELKAVHTDLKHAEKILDLLSQHGVILAAEVNEPRPTLRGLGKAFGNLLGGNAPAPAANAFLPDARIFAIVPDVGDNAETLFGTFRLLVRQSRETVVPFPAALGRKGFTVSSPDKSSMLQLAWWVEGKHFVLYYGSAPLDAVISGMKANQAKGGLLEHSLYQRCRKLGEFESVARGYVDSDHLVTLTKKLAGPFVPGLAEKIDAIGLGNLKAIVFSSGFQGKESRALYELDLPGERRGLAKITRPVPVTLADLPPLPPDVSRFSMLRIDPAGLYDAGLVAFDTLSSGESFGVEDQAASPEEAAKLRKAYLERELTKLLGLNVKDDLLPHLGDRVVLYQTPTEGVSVFGTVLCISVKDGEKVKAATDRLQRGLQSLAGGQMKLRRKVLQGVEIREIYTRGFGVLTPSYAVVGDWLVIAGHPQPIQGFVLRHKNVIEKWQPDAATAARLAKMPADAIGIQYCNPKSVVHNLCCIGPLFLSAVAMNRSDRGEFSPLDIGMIPNGHELGKHLFPNLTYTRDDGKTVRIDIHDSFSLPLEFIGFEPAVFGIMTGLFRF